MTAPATIGLFDAVENVPCKRCRCCGHLVPLESFGVVRSNPDGRRYACKDCYNGIRKLYRKNNPEIIKQQKQEAYYSDHEKSKAILRKRYPKVRAWKLMREYGMTVEEYDEMHCKQGGRCAICGRKPSKATGNSKKPHLHVDHCHKTGIVRGLLCNSCNVGLGSLGDNPDILRSALDYLLKERTD